MGPLTLDRHLKELVNFVAFRRVIIAVQYITEGVTKSVTVQGNRRVNENQQFNQKRVNKQINSSGVSAIIGGGAWEGATKLCCYNWTRKGDT